MAHNSSEKAPLDDVVSLYGSITGGTFVSRRTRRAGSTFTPDNQVDKLAKNLREFDFGPDENCLDGVESTARVQPPSSERFNRSFHHFRFLVVMFAGLAVGLMMLMRYSMTISILKMVNQTHLYLSKHPDKTIEDFQTLGYSSSGEFNWNNEIVAIILSWYMFSYTLPQVPVTRLAAKMGCRLSVPLSLALCAISSILTPASAHWGWEYVVLMRLVNGLGASAVQPMLLHTVENWMRYDEISLGLSISQTLNTIFMTLTPLVTGYLAADHWSYSFYVPGVVTLVFCLLWYVLLSDGPQLSGYLSHKEFEYIMRSESPEEQPTRTGNKKADGSELENEDEDEDEDVYKAHSWLQILKVPSFYSHIIMWCLCSSSYSGFVFVLPTYIQQFLRLTVAETGLVCSLIQLGSIISVLWPYPLLIWLQRRGLSVTSSRIVGQSICCFMVASTWIYVGLFHANQSLVLFMNRCFQGGSDVIVVGALMSNYAKAGLSGFVFSLVNTIGHLSIIICSTLIGLLLDNTGQSRQGWSWIYIGLGVSEVFMWITFTFFIDSQPVKFKSRKLEAKEEGREVSR